MATFTHKFGVSVLLFLALSSSCLAAKTSAQLPENFDVEKVMLNGVTVLSDEQVNHLVQPLVGKNRSFQDLQRAANALREVYAKHGLPNVKITLNPQSLKKGVLHLNISELQYGEIAVKGKQDLSLAQILAALPSLRTGGAVQAVQLATEIAQANRTLDRQLSVNFNQGKQAGVVDVEITVAERKLHTFSVSSNNSGSKATGFARTVVNYQNAGVLNTEHTLALQLTTSTANHKNFYAATANYNVPLAQGGNLSLSGGVTRINVPLDEGEVLQGGNDTLGVRYSHMLSQNDDWTQLALFGIDHTRHHASKLRELDFALFNEVKVTPVTVGYASQFAGEQNKFNASVMMSVNMPRLGGSKQEAFDQYDQINLQAAKANYKVVRVNGMYSHEFENTAKFQAILNGQYSRDSLIQAEKISIGGMGSVRGFKGVAASGASGAFVNLELHSKEINLTDKTLAHVLVFADAGVARVAEQAKASLSSIGVGVRMNYADTVNLSLDIARVGNTGEMSEQKKGDWAGHGNVAISF